MAIGKRYKNLSSKVDGAREYTVDEAVKALKELASAKFDETIDFVANLGVDARQADQQVRGTVSLPHGTGRKVRVVVFAEGEKAQAAVEAGAEAVGADDLAKRIQDGWLDFDVALATPDMMRIVGRLGKVLGPRGLMPNPKSGTVTQDIAKAVTDFKAGKIEYRTNRAGVVHCPIGKASFEPQAIRENLLTVVEALNKAKPSAAKGQYLKSVYVSTTMSPSVKLDTSELRAIL